MTDEKQQTLGDQISAEKERLEKEREEHLANSDLPGFFVPSEGENRFEIVAKTPMREHDFGQGPRKVFRVKVKDEERDWAINPRNPIYREFVNRLAGGQLEFTLLRTGSAQNTRYKFLDKEGQ